MLLQANPSDALSGTIRVPGDKSISHRALMLSAMAIGESRIAGLLEGEDVLATANAMSALGAMVKRQDNEWLVRGVGIGGLAEPDNVLDMGNAGTGARLIAGLIAGNDIKAFLSGDASLRSRPMKRILDPLRQMGAEFTARHGDRLPLAIIGRSDLLPLTYTLPMASAQVKSAILLAGLQAAGRTTVIEPQPTRDHTERMLHAMGAEIVSQDDLDTGTRSISLTGLPDLSPQFFDIPADPSSAAFLIVAALLQPGSQIELTHVSVNPLRTGLLQSLREMGAKISLGNERLAAGEPIADLTIEAGGLDAIDVPPARAPSMIDEYPILAVAASFAKGTTRMRGLAELKVKESDRLQAMADGLIACGINAQILGDDLIVEGRTKQPGDATIDAQLDHRIAMSFLVLGGRCEAPVRVKGAEAIDTSFPGFSQLLNERGAAINLASD